MVKNSMIKSDDIGWTAEFEKILTVHDTHINSTVDIDLDLGLDELLTKLNEKLNVPYKR